MINVHYALQTCNINSNQKVDRYCGNDKTEIVHKCVTSFFTSVAYAAKKNQDAHHAIAIIDDHSTIETITYLKKLAKCYNRDNITVEFISLETNGIMNSIRACWNWLEKNGKDLVYQVQDDYLFEPHAIYEMIDMFMQIYNDTKTEAIVIAYNDPYHWQTHYRYKTTPRTVIQGVNRYWIQMYDVACTFMTSKNQFSQHWDLFETFLNLSPTNGRLEAISLNYMFTKRGLLGVQPVESIALHMQSDFEKDPYIDWKSRWDAVELL
jgi:hypothetical protein